MGWRDTIFRLNPNINHILHLSNSDIICTGWGRPLGRARIALCKYILRITWIIIIIKGKVKLQLNHVKLPRLKLRLFWFSFSSLLPVPPSVPLHRQSYSAPALLLTEVYFLFSPLKLLLILAFLSFPFLLSLSKFATNYAMLSSSFNCFRFLLFLQFYILGFIILSAAPCVLTFIIPRVKFSSFLF